MRRIKLAEPFALKYRTEEPGLVTLTLLHCCRKQVQKRERSLSPVPREYIPAKPLSKKDRKSLKLQKKEQRSATAFHSDVDSLQDQQREQARARRFGNGSAIGAVSGQPTRVGSLYIHPTPL